MNITIRKAATTDFEQIVNLFKEFATFEKHPEKMANSVKQMMDEKDFFNCFVAENSDKRIIGYATWFYAYFTWTGKSLYMDDLYVQPEYRNHGIGRRLINTVIDFARSSGCHKMHWQVSSWNDPAIGFYKSLGAEIDHTEMNCDLILDK
jgi:GNAT superfamily N-acetyltransferase